VAVIETDGLSKFYGAERGIEDVTVSIDAGEVFAFLGPNGAGKTTTIRTLLDLLHPSAGSASIFGLDSHRDSVAIRARLGNLPGDFGYGSAPAVAKHSACWQSCATSTGSAAPRSWRAVSAPTSIGRWASSHAATAKRSA
jgi:ABC-type multidrug transport system ATPase subunit